MTKPVRKNSTEMHRRKRPEARRMIWRASQPILSPRKMLWTVQYSLPNNREIQIQRNEQVENARDLTNIDWKDDGKISEDYAKYLIEFIASLSELESMEDGHLGRVRTSQHGIELTLEDKWPIHSAPNRAGCKACHLKQNEFAKMQEPEVFEPAQTERPLPILFAQKMKDTIRFFIDYKNFNAVPCTNLIPSSVWTGASTCWQTQRLSPR